MTPVSSDIAITYPIGRLELLVRKVNVAIGLARSKDNLGMLLMKRRQVFRLEINMVFIPIYMTQLDEN